MAILPIITAPHPVRSARARQVEAEEFGEALDKLTRDMAETMYAAPGRGLAAGEGRDVQGPDETTGNGCARELTAHGFEGVLLVAPLLYPHASPRGMGSRAQPRRLSPPLAIFIASVMKGDRSSAAMAIPAAYLKLFVPKEKSWLSPSVASVMTAVSANRCLA